jgi:penicillin-binding protein 1B
VTTWVGKDNNKSANLTGSSGALVLFSDYMKLKKGK